MFNNYATPSTYIFQLKQSVGFNWAVASENGRDWILLLFCEQTLLYSNELYNCFLIPLSPILKGGNKILLNFFLFKGKLNMQMSM